MNAKTKSKLGSIEKAPLIRKFTVLFIVMSLLPFLVIAYLFTQYNNFGSINIDQNILVILLFLVGAGTLAGFYGMRRSIMKIQQLTKTATSLVSKKIPGLGEVKQEQSEISQLTHAFNAVTQNLENNIKRLEASKRTMQDVLSKLALGLSSVKTMDTFLDLIVEITANALDAKRGVLMLMDEKQEQLYVKVSSGFDLQFTNIKLKVGEEAPGWVAKHKKPLLIPVVESQQQRVEEVDPFAPPLLSAPMLYQDRLIGVLTVVGKITGGNFQEDELIIIQNLATQTAVAVENDRLHKDAENTYIETISALAMAVEARDPYSRGHSDRVAKYSVSVAKKLGLSEDEIHDIEHAGELHDVGKIGISDEILRKPGILSEEEKKVMHKHPVIGEGIVKPVRTLSRLCRTIRHHHEWIDGSGYPDGIGGNEISIAAKILAVADSFDAMTTDRPYRKGLSVEKAKDEIKKYYGIRYDKKVVDAFLSIV
ncbi:MAG: HD domain-containing protein [Candidatus Gygaella obscura]|nr:HD domain-containing protein [Candidatus Gygaella obscura]